jgi:ribosomal protein S18 acetylase RimI-like enzyme
MALSEELQDVMGEFVRKQGLAESGMLEIAVEDCWTVSILCDLSQLPGLRIRSLTCDDVPALQSFGARLGALSREMFCPYPWDDPSALRRALQDAVEHAVERVDASYVMEDARHDVIAHFFLWKAGGNPHSIRHQIQVPELGVAVADQFQGRGLGSLAVHILQAVARALNADAIELTTALTNEAGRNIYQKRGFEYIGIINNPLEVDVTAAATGEAQALKYRQERQMVYVINEGKRDRVLAYLLAKREAAAAEIEATSNSC